MGRFRATPVLIAAVLAAAACSGGDAAPVVTITVAVGGEFSPINPVETPEEAISFWSTETQPERIEITAQIIDDFTEKTGIEVIRVYISEDALPGAMEAAAANGHLPEVIFHPVDYTLGWAQQGWLDVAAADAVVESLGRRTFSPAALALADFEGRSAAVPSDGWGQLLIYRRDLFEAAALEVPNTFERIERAASILHGSSSGMVGIAAASAPDTVFTQQTFEQFALANDCRLIAEDGTIGLGSDACIETIDFYTRLVGSYGPDGPQDAISVRSRYFSGKAAMIVWSPFILDEMAGLRDNALPNCALCAENTAFLAENSGVVPSFRGPRGSDVQYGQVSLMGIGAGSQTAAAQALLDYWFNDAYLDWLSAAPEGKVPMRQGRPDDTTHFIDLWPTLVIGVDRKARIDEVYGDTVVATLVVGSNSFDRWGFAEGRGELVSAMYASLAVPSAIDAVLQGTLTPELAADLLTINAQTELEKLQRAHTVLEGRS